MWEEKGRRKNNSKEKTKARQYMSKGEERVGEGGRGSEVDIKLGMKIKSASYSIGKLFDHKHN